MKDRAGPPPIPSGIIQDVVNREQEAFAAGRTAALTPPATAGDARKAAEEIVEQWLASESWAGDYRKVIVGDIAAIILHHFPPSAEAKPGLTEGWVLVPREPIVDMVERGRAALSQGDAKVQTHARVMWVWEAMISAVPPPPAADVAGEMEAREMNRILALSDEEVIAEAIAAGEDPEEVATRGRDWLEEAIVIYRALEVAAKEYAKAGSNSEFQRSLMQDAFIAGASWQRWQARSTRASAGGERGAAEENELADAIQSAFERDYLSELEGLRDNLFRLSDGEYASNITQRLWTYWEAARSPSSSTTAMEIGRGIGREEAAKVCDAMAEKMNAQYTKLIAEGHVDRITPIIKEYAATALATAIRALTPPATAQKEKDNG